MSVCSTCGLPTSLCVCEQIAMSEISVSISVEKRAYGKNMTIISGLDDSKINIKKIAKMLKSRCATGGTIKGTTIELQGLQLRKVVEVLSNQGIQVNVMGKR